jgi:hypothetical protein
MNLWTYSPEDVLITIGGFYSIEGIPQGTFVSVRKDLPSFVSTRSTDGIVARTKVINSSYTIEITLMSTSPSNDTLTRLWQLDELTSMGKFPLLIKDTNGTGFFFSTETWIEVAPDLEYAETAGTFTWGLRSDGGMIHIGGNDENTAIEDIADLILSGLPYVQQVLSAQGFSVPKVGSIEILEG